MPQPWVSGPTTVLVDGRELGTAERYPRYLVRSGWQPYFNDISGPVIPMDMLWAGKEAFIYLDLNRYDEEVLEFFQSITDNSDPLSWPGNSIGTLMIHEEQAIPIQLNFPYADKPKYAGMPKGVLFNAGWYEGPEEFSVLGTNPRKVHVIIHCLATQAEEGGNWVLGELL
jgi:hypothetical protein